MRWVQMSMIAVVLTSVFGVWVAYRDITLTRAVEGGLVVTDAEWNDLDAQAGFLALAALGANVAAAVAFLVWLHAAYRIHEQSSSNPRFSAGWAVGMYFVPIVNLIRPLHVMRELTEDPGKPPPLVNWWWLTFVAALVLGAVAGRSPQPETFDEVYALNWLVIAASGARIAAAVLGIAVADLATRTLTARDEHRLGERGGH